MTTAAHLEVGAPTPVLHVEWGLAYEFLMSLAVVTSAERGSYLIGDAWFDAVRADAPAWLLDGVVELSGGSDMVWAHLVSVAHQLAPPRDVDQLITAVADADPIDLRLCLLGFHVRWFRRMTAPAVIAAAATGDCRAQREFLATSYPLDVPWQRALRALLPLDGVQTRRRLLRLLRGWQRHVFAAREPEVRSVLARDAAATRRLAGRQAVEDVVAGLLGWPWSTPRGTREILLVPSFVLRPQTHVFDHDDTAVVCHPVRDASLPGLTDDPPLHLVRSLRALGDARRLRLLKRLTLGPATLADLAAESRVAATTLAHHLQQLRAAGLLRASGRPVQTWSARPEVLEEVLRLLGGQLQVRVENDGNGEGR